MKWILGYSPPFSAFLIDILNTGRKMNIENDRLVGADRERTDSG